MTAGSMNAVDDCGQALSAAGFINGLWTNASHGGGGISRLSTVRRQWLSMVQAPSITGLPYMRRLISIHLLAVMLSAAAVAIVASVALVSMGWANSRNPSDYCMVTVFALFGILMSPDALVALTAQSITSWALSKVQKVRVPVIAVLCVLIGAAVGFCAVGAKMGWEELLHGKYAPAWNIIGAIGGASCGGISFAVWKCNASGERGKSQ